MNAAGNAAPRAGTLTEQYAAVRVTASLFIASAAAPTSARSATAGRLHAADAFAADPHV